MRNATRIAIPDGVLTLRQELWTPVINDLKSFGDAMVSVTDTSWLYILLAGFVTTDRKSVV